MARSLAEALSRLADSVADCARAGRQVSVTTHIDCDGLAAGGILAKALARAGAPFTASAVREFGSSAVEALRAGTREFHIVADLGSGAASMMDKALGEDWFVLDHHQIPDEEMDDARVANAWAFGMDGGTGVCAGGMAYMAAKAMDGGNADLAPAAVVAALGDRQDSGERRSLSGANGDIAAEAEEAGLLDVSTDLLLVGRETRPLPDALAYTSSPFIEGITWRRDACAALLSSAGIPLKSGGRWRVPADLTEEEKRSVVEALAGRAAGDSVDGLVGSAYTFPEEDALTFLRDAREYSTLLNACGRTGRTGTGMAVCMGDRGRALRGAEEALKEYRKSIRTQMDALTGQGWKRVDEEAGEGLVVVNGEGVVPETMSGTLASLVAGAPGRAGKIVVLWTGSGGDPGKAAGEKGAPGGSVKISSRMSASCSTGANLGRIMGEAAAECGGVGGGHARAAGARITRDKLGRFLGMVGGHVAKVHGAGGAQ